MIIQSSDGGLCLYDESFNEVYGYSPCKLATKYGNLELRKHYFMLQDRAVKLLRNSGQQRLC